MPGATTWVTEQLATFLFGSRQYASQLLKVSTDFDVLG